MEEAQQALAYGDHLIRAQKRQKTKKLRGRGQEEKAGSSARALGHFSSYQ